MASSASDDDAGAGARFRSEDANVRRGKETQPAQRSNDLEVEWEEVYSWR